MGALPLAGEIVLYSLSLADHTEWVSTQSAKCPYGTSQAIFFLGLEAAWAVPLCVEKPRKGLVWVWKNPLPKQGAFVLGQLHRADILV